MFRSSSAILLLFWFNTTFSQASFQLYTNDEDPSENFAPIFNLSNTGNNYGLGYSKMADFDGDGFPDIVQDGLGESAAIWYNDGNGNFSDFVPGPSDNPLYVSKLVADLDDDGDQDIFYSSGYSLYNDGSGNFSITPEPGVIPQSRSIIDYKELDGAASREIIVANSAGNNRFLNVYRRNDDGYYTAIYSQDISGMEGFGYHVADIDNDGDNDVITFGLKNETGNTEFSFYLNNGSGSFDLDTPLYFEGLYNGVVGSNDLNGDGFLDLVISGVFGDVGGQEVLTKIYMGIGGGEFMEDLGQDVIATAKGGIELSDFNQDGETDILIAGSQSNVAYAKGITKLYFQFDGNFIESSINDFPSLVHPTFQRIDNDGDGDLDLLIEGYAQNGIGVPFSRIFVNNGNGSFSEMVSDKHIARNYTGQIINTEGDQKFEIHFSGVNDEMKFEKLTYRVNEAGELEEAENQLPIYSIEPVFSFDMDSDGDMDLIQLTSEPDSAEHEMNTPLFFRNLGNGEFEEESVGDLIFYGGSRSFFVDLNSDSFPDVLIEHGPIYLNLNGTVFEQIDSPFYGYNTDFYPTDFDSDGDNDVIGVTRSIQNFVSFYENDGDANFQFDEELAFSFGSNWNYDVTATEFFEAADIDGDGDIDLVIKMLNLNTKVFLNDDSGYVQSSEIYADDLKTLRLVDLDSDGFLDVFCSQHRSDGGEIMTFYNDGFGNFFEEGSDQFESFDIENLYLKDIEGDGDVDVLYTGLDLNGRIASRLYLNTTYTLDLDDNKQNLTGLKVFPNPSTGSFQVSADLAIESVVLYDIQGREVFQATHSGGYTFVPSALNLTNGVYIVSVRFENGESASEKLVITNRF